jgi:hypothetical protein
MDNIEDIYYNKYLKYKYKYLELKGNGLAEIIRKSIEEQKYGVELLNEIKNITNTNDIDKMIWTNLFKGIFTRDKRPYTINLIDNIEISLIDILEKISIKKELTEISSYINLIKDKINDNKIQEYNLRMTKYEEIEKYINDVFKKHTLLSTYSKILKKLFNVYFVIIKKVKEQKEQEEQEEQEKDNK